MNARKETKYIYATTQEKDEAEYFEVKFDQIRRSIKKVLKIIANAVNYENAIKYNNELRTKGKYQQDQIKHLQEKFDIEDGDEVQEMTAAIIS